MWIRRHPSYHFHPRELSYPGKTLSEVPPKMSCASGLTWGAPSGRPAGYSPATKPKCSTSQGVLKQRPTPRAIRFTLRPSAIPSPQLNYPTYW